MGVFHVLFEKIDRDISRGYWKWTLQNVGHFVETSVTNLSS